MSNPFDPNGPRNLQPQPGAQGVTGFSPSQGGPQLGQPGFNAPAGFTPEPPTPMLNPPQFAVGSFGPNGELLEYEPVAVTKKMPLDTRNDRGLITMILVGIAFAVYYARKGEVTMQEIVFAGIATLAASVLALFSAIIWKAIVDTIARIWSWGRAHPVPAAVIIALLASSFTTYVSHYNLWSDINGPTLGYAFAGWLLLSAGYFSLIFAYNQGLGLIANPAPWQKHLMVAHSWAGTLAGPLGMAIYHTYVMQNLGSTFMHGVATVIVSEFIALGIYFCGLGIIWYGIKVAGNLEGLLKTEAEKREHESRPVTLRAMLLACTIAGILVGIGVGNSLWPHGDDVSWIEYVFSVFAGIAVAIVYNAIEASILVSCYMEEGTSGSRARQIGIAFGFASLTFVTTFSTIYKMETAESMRLQRQAAATTAAQAFLAEVKLPMEKKIANAKTEAEARIYDSADKALDEGMSVMNSARKEAELQSGMNTFRGGANTVAPLMGEVKAAKLMPSLNIPPMPSTLRQGVNAFARMLHLSSAEVGYYSSEDAVGALTGAIFFDMLIPLLSLAQWFKSLVWRRKQLIAVKQGAGFAPQQPPQV